MFGTPEKLESRRNHITITCDQETGSSPYHSNGGGNHSDDTPTKSNLVETCGLNLLNVKKSINFGLSRENSSDSFIQRDTATKKNLFFEVENLKFEDLYDFSQTPEESNSFALKPKTGSVAKVNNTKIALFRYGEVVHAIDEKCPHLGGPLHMGDIENIGEASLLCVVCPWHRWKIDLTTGKVKMPSRRQPVRNQIYPTRIDEDGSIHIGFEEIDNQFFDGEEMDF
ncbi:uncharacterized protein [Clytia hemisphaerica]|uniref:Rieske domain-containing protein n=1 Tax=Clytia hemisphaerica TaxID=252671 RepID=A0A7M5WYE6_9CNID